MGYRVHESSTCFVPPSKVKPTDKICVSGWEIALGLAAVVFALLLILAVKGTYVEEESTSNPLRQVVFVMILLLLICTAVSLGLIAVVSGNIKTHVSSVLDELDRPASI